MYPRSKADLVWGGTASTMALSQRGLGLPATLFVLVILGLLAVAITELEQSAAEGVSMSMLSTRAFYAAESGAQSGLARLFDFDTGDPNTVVNPTACIADFSLTYTVAGLSGCTAAVTCSLQRADMDADGSAEYFFTIDSTGTCDFGDTSAMRSVEVRAR